MSQLLTGPLFTIILTILAGIALRYALWYSKDSTPLDDATDVEDLKERQRTLQEAIAREQADRAHLSGEYERMAQEYESLKVALDTRDEKLHEQRLRIKQLEQAAATDGAATGNKTKQAAELERSREALSELQAELRTATQALEAARRDADHAREEAARAGRESELARQELEVLRRETDSIDVEKSQVSQALENAARQRAQLEQQIKEEQRARNGVAAELAALRETATQLKTELTIARRERDEAMTAEAATRADLTGQLAQVEENANRIKRYAEELRERGQAADGEVVRIRQEHQAEMEALRAELSAAQHESQERLRDLRTEKEEVLKGLVREQEENQRLHQLLIDATERVALLEPLRAELEKSRQLAVEREQEFSHLLARAEAAEGEHGESKTALMRAERRVAELSGSVHRYEQEITNNEAAVRKLRVERDRLTTQLERERAERNALEQTLRTHIDTLEQLREDSQSLESLLQRQTVVQNSLRSHAERLRSAAYNKEAARGDSDIITIHKYDTPSATGQLHRHPVLGMVYSSPPAERDNLQRISGISEALESKLNQVGVYSYEQIMHWDETVIEAVSSLIDAADRMTRDGWVAQARALHLELQEQRAA